MFGLKDKDIATIQLIINKHPEVEEALVFGSRANGTYRQGSDVDIALKGRNITHSTVIGIYSKLEEETLMPYMFDVINYHTLDEEDLRNHIDRVGQLIYTPHVVLSLKRLAQLQEAGFKSPDRFIREHLIKELEIAVNHLEKQAEEYEEQYQSDFISFTKSYTGATRQMQQDVAAWKKTYTHLQEKKRLLNQLRTETDSS